MSGYSDMYKDMQAAQERRAQLEEAAERALPELTEDNMRAMLGRALIAERTLGSLTAQIRNVINTAFGGSVRTL